MNWCIDETKQMHFINVWLLKWCWAVKYLQVSMSAEDNFPLTPKWIRINLPCKHSIPCSYRISWNQYQMTTPMWTTLTNLEELSFLMVLALPKASRAGLHWMIWSSRVPWASNFNINCVKQLLNSYFIHSYIFPYIKTKVREDIFM